MSNHPIDLRSQLATKMTEVQTEHEQLLANPTPTRAIKTAVKTSAHYEQLARIEGRLHPEQLDALTTLRSRLNRAKPAGTGERITNNTLLRVAVTILLEHQDGLTGFTETELTESLRRSLR